MIGTALLNETIIENEVTRVNEVLDTIRNHIIKSFEQEGSKNHVHDGMDIALIDLDPDKRKLSFSGAGQRFYILRDGEVIDVIGNYCPVGYYFGRETPFEIQEIKILPGDQLYLFSDGIIDQFGGDLNKKFTFKQLKEVLLKGAHLPMEEQNKMLDEAVVSWQGDNAQTDDISVMGLRIS
jgi:serine phosphatase RsbU (regulator of sigma subunit)